MSFVGVALVAGGAFLIGVAVHYAWRALRAAVRALIEQEPSVAGNYETFDSANALTRVGNAKLIQRGRCIRIEAQRLLNRKGTEFSAPKRFYYTGKFHSGILTAMFVDEQTRYRTGVIVLKYDAASQRLCGKTTYGGDATTEPVESFYFEMRPASYSPITRTTQLRHQLALTFGF